MDDDSTRTNPARMVRGFNNFMRELKIIEQSGVRMQDRFKRRSRGLIKNLKKRVYFRHVVHAEKQAKARRCGQIERGILKRENGLAEV